MMSSFYRLCRCSTPRLLLVRNDGVAEALCRRCAPSVGGVFCAGLAEFGPQLAMWLGILNVIQGRGERQLAVARQSADQVPMPGSGRGALLTALRVAELDG